MKDNIKEIAEKLKNLENIKDSPYLSIIIPVYNTEKYLKRCLDSIVNQSFKDIEVIVVDYCCWMRAGFGSVTYLNTL